MSDSDKKTPIEQIQELVQSKSDEILETLKGLTYERAKDIIETVATKIESQIMQTKL